MTSGAAVPSMVNGSRNETDLFVPKRARPAVAAFIPRGHDARWNSALTQGQSDDAVTLPSRLASCSQNQMLLRIVAHKRPLEAQRPH